MKIILIELCNECPCYVDACMGKKSVCGNPKIMVKFPYGENRRVVGNEKPPKFCPLKECQDAR